MSTEQPPSPKPTIARRPVYRRPWVIVLLFFVALFLAWWGWGYWQNRNDARLLDEYLAELYQRDPKWKERVYGTYPSDEHSKTRSTLDSLMKELPTTRPEWGPYWAGLHQGLVQDPDHPAALFPKEQVEFLDWVGKIHTSFFSKVSFVDQLSPLNRPLIETGSWDSRRTALQSDHIATYQLNEILQLQTIGRIQAGDVDGAIAMIRRLLRLNQLRQDVDFLYQSTTPPFLIERFLGLNTPDGKNLETLQREIEEYAKKFEPAQFENFGREVRLMESLVKDIDQDQKTIGQLERNGWLRSIIPEDSHWNAGWLQWARPYYLIMRVKQHYRRPHYITLRLHQLADRIESIGIEPLSQRWHNWKSFAQANGLTGEVGSMAWRYPNPLNTEAVPSGVFYLTPYAHGMIALMFQRDAQLKTTLVALAAERFRLDHIRFPKDQSELIPKYLPKEVLDSFTGKPLIIKPTDKGIVIYSVGREGKDEGGENLIDHHYWNYGGRSLNWKRTNLGTRVYLPQHRRQPPIQLNDFQLEGLNKWKKFEADKKAEPRP